MAARTNIAARFGRALYLLIILATLAAGAWAYWAFVYTPGTESFTAEYEGQVYEMLDPEWLVIALIIPLLWVVRVWTLSDLPWLQRLLNVGVRSLVILALCLAATRVVSTDYEEHVTTIVIVDVSTSVPDSMLVAAQTWLEELYQARGENDIRLITFARDAIEVPIAPGAAEFPEIRRHSDAQAGLESNLDRALRTAYGLFPQEDIKRIVLLSDGNLNRGDTLSEVYNASRYGILVFQKELEYVRDDEVLVQNVIFPRDISTDEDFTVEIDLFSNYDGQVRLQIWQNEYEDFDDWVNVAEDRTVTACDPQRDGTCDPILLRVYEPGLRNFEIRITPRNDETTGARRDRFTENNSFHYSVEVSGRPQVLYVEGGSSRYLRRALNRENNSDADFDLETREASGIPDNSSELANFDLVILSDVPSSRMSRSRMSALRDYIRGGGRFLNIGGEDSFGPGGYEGTIMEEILPVSFESRRTETMPSVAILLLIDRSGSMEGVRLEMAKDAARATVELLGPQDRVGVIAFDSAPHEIVRLQNASNRVRIDSQISRISPGGGTDFLPALLDAHIALWDTSARIKHIILLTDGEASTGGIADAVREMRRDRITISTVGIGNADHNVLEMIADLSDGTFYRASSPSDIPQIFIQDTNQITRSSFAEDPFRPVREETNRATRGIDFSSAPYLLGYVMTRAKRGATVSLETDTGDPLYAHWRFGRGLAAVFTADCKNHWMTEWIGESIYQRWWTQVVQHLMRPRSEEDELLEMEVYHDKGRGYVRVDVIDEAGEFVNGIESRVYIDPPYDYQEDENAEDGEDDDRIGFDLQQVAAGRYEGSFPLGICESTCALADDGICQDGGDGAASTLCGLGTDCNDCGFRGYGTYQVEAEHFLDDESFSRSEASLAYAYPEELLGATDNYALLQQAVQLAGGATNPTTTEVFDPGEERVAREKDLWPWFLFAALGLFMLDVLLRRLRLYGRINLDWARVTGR